FVLRRERELLGALLERLLGVLDLLVLALDLHVLELEELGAFLELLVGLLQLLLLLAQAVLGGLERLGLLLELPVGRGQLGLLAAQRSGEHTSELQSLTNLVCRLLL